MAQAFENGDAPASEGSYVSLKQDPNAAGHELALEVGEDPLSFDAAMMLAANRVIDGEPIPEGLREAVSGFLRGEIKRPSWPSKPLGATTVRDRMIVELIDDVIQATGLKPTSSDGEAGMSACNAVAHAFSLQGLNPRSYELIRKIWAQRKSLRGIDTRHDW